MASELDDVAAFEDEDAVRVHDGRQPVGDQNGDRFLIGCNLADGSTDFFFRQRVER